MKLAILCTMVKRFGRKGYYNSQEIGLGRALAGLGHEVIIYKGTDDRSQVETIQLADRLVIHYLYMPHLGAHGYFDVRLMDAGIEGVFCFSDQQIFLPHVMNDCRRRGIPFVPYIGTTFSLYGDSLRAKVMNRVFAMTTLPRYRKMKMLAKTDSSRKELLDLGVPAENVAVSPVGIDASVLKKDFLSADRAELRRAYGITPEEVVLLNVARLEPDKRTLEMLDIFSKIRGKKPFRLLIVGDGSMRDAVNEKIHALGVEKEVTIVPKVPYAEMWKLYTLSDYYLNMSKTEIFGMAIMEAVYYHTSVAAINALGPSITLKGMRGHALCEDDEAIANWVLGEYPSEEILKESSDKMIRDFSWERTAKAFLRMIEEQKK